jgi:hypothetical protein
LRGILSALAVVRKTAYSSNSSKYLSLRTRSGAGGLLDLTFAIRFSINSSTLSSSLSSAFYSFGLGYCDRALVIMFFFLGICLILKFYISIAPNYLFIIASRTSAED